MTEVAEKKSALAYRADIDGLRGIAVLLVLAYHLRISGIRGLPRFQGGFIGVDVFFVISGFLISSVILGEMAAGKFSLVSFYERRIRRIFPALFVMMFVTAVLAYKYFLPTELEDYAKSLVAATFSVSNIFFWRQSGYFDTPATMKPLLHTWSLAVEEQFYIFFPLFLALVRRFFPNKLRQAVVAIAGISFAVSAIGAFKAPVSTFYLAHTRAWELLLGTILALKILPEIRGAVQRNLAAAAGVIFIVAAGSFYTTATPFPGLAALAPCVGAALIIAAGQSGTSWTGQALAMRPLVFVGLISYSRYLWHWPLIVFQDVGTLLVSGLPERFTKVVVIVASAAIATVSWKFVEVPFRSGRLKLKGAAAFQAGFGGAAVVGAMGVCMLLFHGMPSRFPADAVRVASYLDYNTTDELRIGSCFITPKYQFTDFQPATCLREDDTKKNYLLLGDSHAAHLWYGLSSTLSGVNVMQASASSCRPTLEQPKVSAESCRELMNYVFTNYLASHHVDVLLLSCRWAKEDVPRLTQTLAWLKQRDIQVIVFGPIVQYDSPLPRLLATSIKNTEPGMAYQHRVAESGELDREMLKLAATDWKVRYISLVNTMCNSASCVEYAPDGVPMQYDSGHLTRDGSVLVAQRLRASGEMP